MRSPFGILLASLIETKGFSANRFAKDAKLPTNYIYRILRGDRPAPSKHLEAMIATLGLDVHERYEFLMRAALSHIPSDTVEPLEAVRARLGLPPLFDLPDLERAQATGRKRPRRRP